MQSTRSFFLACSYLLGFIFPAPTTYSTIWPLSEDHYSFVQCAQEHGTLVYHVNRTPPDHDDFFAWTDAHRPDHANAYSITTRPACRYPKIAVSPCRFVRIFRAVHPRTFAPSSRPLVVRVGLSNHPSRRIRLGEFIYDPFLYGHGLVHRFKGFQGAQVILEVYFRNGSLYVPPFSGGTRGHEGMMVEIITDVGNVEMPALVRQWAHLRKRMGATMYTVREVDFSAAEGRELYVYHT